ncbi:hypothetical protein I302_105370 [Kwoniella bestiolae CBS 10118]|uniref:Ubiquilin n=1 Tax=Kwoniella bestiolae CBS 10118 TaxID=1296100 RepID=A0A1B9FSY5_9TREE|nr:ubiquilin [Kwoniella bestiolae CBS 10118]OCF21873.1 ubiquilin [Kwoniella bestiolae CBS 10118]
MSADAAASSSEITITVKGPSELKLSITIAPEKTVAELKESIASKSDVEKERQRLIYSGKVLKDEDTISTYKIQTGHTIHMVKGAAKSNNPSGSTAAPAGGSSASSALPRLPQMGTGLNVGSNPIDNVENIHHGLAGFNPFAGQPGLDNMFDPNAMTGMMNNPDFLRSMSEMMSRPEVLDQIIASNPQLQAMGPQVRQMMQSPFFRQMMSNPETLRAMMQMNASMGGQGGGMGGFNPFGAAPGGGQGGQTGTANVSSDPFPNLFAPNAPSTTNTENPSTPSGNAQQPPNPLAALFGGAGAGGAGGAGGNPFGGFDPSMLFGGGGRAGGFGGFGAPPAPRDERPPEEIYATQLGQLNGMGLWDAQKNITALRRTGGNVEAAIELIFSGQLD